MVVDTPKVKDEAPKTEQAKVTAEKPSEKSSPVIGGKPTPSIGDKLKPTTGEADQKKPQHTTVYSMEEVRSKREEVAKKEPAEPEAEKTPPEAKPEKRRGRPPKEDKAKDKAKQAVAPKKENQAAEKKPKMEATAKTEPGRFGPKVSTAPVAAKEPEKPAEPVAAPRSGKVEKIVHLKLSELHAFKNHPFGVRDDDEMRAMVASVKDKGVSQPAIVRPLEGGGYEIVSGHRRQKASELAGFVDMPCIIRNLTDEQAITQMVEDNTNQREAILPSERGKALKMQLEAIKHQGTRETPGQIDPKEAGKRSNEIVALRNKMTVKQVQRFIKLNDLVPDLSKMLDEKRISFTPAVEFAFISKKNQNYIAVAIDAQQSAPSLAQAQRMRELDQKGILNGDVIDGIMCEEKKEVDKVIISGAELGKYFGKEKTPQEMKGQIIKLLDEWTAKEKAKEQAKPEKKTQKEK